ncbi:MAG: hypothetical protein R3F35_19705 [Myxococcota bacterium]
MSRPCSFPASLVLVAAVVAAFAPAAVAQVLRHPDALPQPVYRVGALELRYAAPHPDQPPLDPLTPVVVELARREQGYAAPSEGESTERVEVGAPGGPVVPLEASGLARVFAALVERLNAEGLYGIDVRPAPEDIDVTTEADRRPADRTALAVVVFTGRVARVRTIAIGDRVDGDWRIDNTLHESIRLESPLQPAGEGLDDTTDLLDRRRLEDYLYRLNRYRGRMVEAALSPGEEPGEVVLDYRVYEAKPWYVYGQATNTGTKRTNPWQSRLGFTHTQLSNHDDTLSLEWLNAGGEDVNGVSARYDAPFFGPRRPEWMDRRKGDPDWIAWLPREKIPWWGIDRLRWGVDFGWFRSLAGRDSTFQGLPNDLVRTEQFDFGGRFAYEAFQHRDFFIDAIAGLGVNDVTVDNDTSGNVGKAVLVLPRAGLHAERINQLSTLTLDTGVQGQVNAIPSGDLDTLGRAQTDDRYVVLDFDLGWSAFLEPLLRPAAWRDPSNELAATLAHEVSLGLRGQYGFDYRLIPQASQTLGGFFSVRGYDQSVAVGDTVVVGSFEYRFHLPRALPVTRRPLRLPLIGDFRVAPQQVYGRPDWDLMLRAFVDAGRAERNDRRSSGTGAGEYNQTLVGAGIGAELVFRSNLRARVDYAFALKDTNGTLSNPAHVGDSALHVLVSLLY